MGGDLCGNSVKDEAVSRVGSFDVPFCDYVEGDQVSRDTDCYVIGLYVPTVFSFSEGEDVFAVLVDCEILDDVCFFPDREKISGCAVGVVDVPLDYDFFLVV